MPLIKLSNEELQNKTESNHVRHEAGEQIYKEQKMQKVYSSRDSYRRSRSYYFNLDSIYIFLTFFGLCNLSDNELII